jgi:HK97 gp10 family phage protein
MPSVRMRIEGGAELGRALRSLSTRLSRSVQREALRDVAGPLATTMTRLAPRSDHAPHMADTITVSNAKADTSTAVAVAVGPTKAGWYGSFAELGTSRETPQPFLRPALDHGVSGLLRDIARRLWTALASRGVQRETRVGSGPVSGGPGGGGL